MNVEQLIKETLNIPVLSLHEPIMPPCATYYLDSENTELFGDGRKEEGAEVYFIDLWCKNRDEATQKNNALKKKLDESLYNVIQSSRYQYDANGRLWRSTIVLSHVKEEENE